MTETIARMAAAASVSANGQRRAFAQKLNKAQASEVRRQIKTQSGNLPKSLSDNSVTVSPLSSQIAAAYVDVPEPVDYEDFFRAHQPNIDRDPLRHLLQFPIDDIEVKTIPKKPRTVTHVLPENTNGLNSRERDCIQEYTANYTVSFRRYQRYGPCEVLAETIQVRVA